MGVIERLLTMEVLAPLLFERFWMCSHRELGRQLIKVNKQKDEDAQEEVIPVKNFRLKELQEILHNHETTKEKILEADPNLERSMTIYQGTEKVLHMSHNKMKEGETVHTALDKFLFLNVSNVLHYSVLNQCSFYYFFTSLHIYNRE